MVKIKRLFITTGNFSLLNALTIIRNDDPNGYEDTLLILSFQGSHDFVMDNIRLASLHKFHNILFLKLDTEVSLSDLFAPFDMIYITIYHGNQHFVSKLDKEYPDKKFWLIDEGISYVPAVTMLLKNKNNIFINNFLDKFNFSSSQHIKYISKELFNRTCELANKRFCKDEVYQEEKSVLIVGNYIFYLMLGIDRTVEYYKHMIELFSSNGFILYFKPHPRELAEHTHIINDFVSSKNIKIINTSFPMEVNNFNFTCIAGSFSNSLVTYPYLKDIPAIHFKLDEIYEASDYLEFLKTIFLVEYYTPNINLFTNYLHLPHAEFKQKLHEIHEGFIKGRQPYMHNYKLKTVLNAKNKFLFNFYRKTNNFRYII